MEKQNVTLALPRDLLTRVEIFATLIKSIIGGQRGYAPLPGLEELAMKKLPTPKIYILMIVLAVTVLSVKHFSVDLCVRPGSSFPDHRIHDHQQLAHTGCDGHFERLPFRYLLLIHLPDHRVMTDT
jgi:hypothetical protein